MTEMRRVVTDDEKTALYAALPRHATPMDIGEMFMTMMGMYGLDDTDAKMLVMLLGVTIAKGDYEDYLARAGVSAGSREMVQ